MLRLGWRYRRACLGVLVLHTLLVGLTLSGLGLTGLGIDVIRHQFDPAGAAPRWPLGLAPPSSWSAMQAVTLIASLVLFLAMMNAVLRYSAAVATAYLTQRIVVRLRSDVYDKLQRLSFRFFDATDSSSIINRAAGDVQAVRLFIDGVIIKVLTVLLSLAVYLAYMLSVHVPLTIACLITSPLLWVGAVLFSRMVQPGYLTHSRLVDHMVLTLVENIQGVHVVKGFARENQEIAKFTGANQQIKDQKQRIFWTISTYQPIMGMLTQVNMLVLLGYGGWLVIHGQLHLGAGMFVFANLLHEFANQVGQITNISNSIQTSLTGAQRVFEVLDAPIEIKSRPDAVRLPQARGEVRFEHVCFRYATEEADGAKGADGTRSVPATLAVLQDVSFDVRPGQCIAFVGPTGAGKSTLLSLIPRFYDVASGRVLVDGVDVRDLNLDDLRRNIGIVFQESYLFSNTIAANIAFGHPDATPEQIERAARIAAAHEFIADVPDGYETVIGEQGSNLSGGQRQRLAIARALLLDPPILILDDATASVDSETEHEIREAVENAMRGRTTFLVSNRISALRHADKIIVLDKGRIIQVGTHAELLRARGYYRRLAELQFADTADELVDGDRSIGFQPAREEREDGSEGSHGQAGSLPYVAADGTRSVPATLDDDDADLREAI